MRLRAAIGGLSVAFACALAAAGCQKGAPESAVSTDSASTEPSAIAVAKLNENQPASLTEAAADPAAGEEESTASKAPEANEVASVDSAVVASAVVSKPKSPIDITFDDIKFDIKPDAPFKRSMLTEKIEKLAGKHVRIRGYILPSFQQTGLTQFVLVRDNQACCFGPGAALYDCIVVEMKPGKSTDFNLYPVAVEGTFTVSEMKDPDGKALAIYHLDGDEVR